MHIKKVNKLLKKINNLHEGFLEYGDDISKIEKELLLSYIKNLYEAVIDGDEGFVPLVEPKELVESIEKDAGIAEDNIEEAVDENPIFEELKESKEEVEDKEIDNKKIDNKKILEPTKTVKKPKEKDFIVKVEEKIEDVKEEVGSNDSYNIPTDYNLLFEPIEVKELSAKLANSPIKSIKAKLGINEKLLTVKELFAKDQEAFNESIEILDNMNSFEEVKRYLSQNIIEKYGWDSEEKIKKAIRFINIIQRRYL